MFKHDYGIVLPYRLNQRLVEGISYLTGRSEEDGGVGRYEHFRRYIGLTWPKMLTDDHWHPWQEWRLRTFCDEDIGVTRLAAGGIKERVSFRNNSWSGCGAAAKTFDAGLIAMAWWSVDPRRSSVILCSTSKTMVRRRVWPVIQKLFHEAVDSDGKPLRLGHMLDSQTMLQRVRGDSKYAIAAFAVEQGELQSSIGKMKGMHTPRMLMIVDEADSTPSAVFELIANFRKGCQEFVLITIGNAVSQLDPHGQICEPKDGWESVTVDSDEWETKGVARWNVEPGICLHFDGERSPNVRLGRTKWPFLYTYEDYLAARAKPDYAESIQYWSMERGFWAPEGAVNRVLTPQKIVRHHARENFIWLKETQGIAGLDPAFGGNQCVLQFGIIGDAEEQAGAIELTDTIEIRPNAKSALPVDHQIAERVIKECAERNVSPKNFGMDTTGPGRGIAAILAAQWSSEFVRVEFGGGASDKSLGYGDDRLAKDVYANRVTELWFQAARMIEHDKLRGLPLITGHQLCMRPYELRGKRMMLVPKDKMRELHGKSPDHADAFVVLCEVAKLRGAGGGESRHSNDDWRKFRRKASESWEMIGSSEDKVCALWQP